MKSAISRLESELWSACVYRCAAKDDDTVKRWQTDDYSHLKEGFIIGNIPSHAAGLIKNALEEWQKIEEQVCARLKMSRDEFLREFEKLREDYLNEGNRWQSKVLMLQGSAYGAVMNISWVDLFSWILPNADKTNVKKYKETGRMVTALFYVEQLGKYGLRKRKDENVYPPPERTLNQIETRWRIVNEL